MSNVNIDLAEWYKKFEEIFEANSGELGKIDSPLGWTNFTRNLIHNQLFPIFYAKQ